MFVILSNASNALYKVHKIQGNYTSTVQYTFLVTFIHEKVGKIQLFHYSSLEHNFTGETKYVFIAFLSVYQIRLLKTGRIRKKHTDSTESGSANLVWRFNSRTPIINRFFRTKISWLCVLNTAKVVPKRCCFFSPKNTVPCL